MTRLLVLVAVFVAGCSVPAVPYQGPLECVYRDGVLVGRACP